MKAECNQLETRKMAELVNKPNTESEETNQQDNAEAGRTNT